jgi:hypothetical protein
LFSFLLDSRNFLTPSPDIFNGSLIIQQYVAQSPCVWMSSVVSLLFIFLILFYCGLIKYRKLFQFLYLLRLASCLKIWSLLEKVPLAAEKNAGLIDLAGELVYNFCFFLVVVLGCWTQGLALTKQVLYHLNHTTSPFCNGYFWDRVLLYAWAVLD